MSKSRFIIIFAAFSLCILLFSCQWQPDAKLAAANKNTADSDVQSQSVHPGSIAPAELYEKVNGKTPEEVYSVLSSYDFEFNRNLYPGNELIQAGLFKQSLQNSNDEVYILELGQSGLNYQYIILQGKAEAFAYKGSIILPGNRATGDDFRIAEDPISGTVWVVIRELVGSGTGISQYNEVWYRISDRIIVNDLHYIIQMHEWMSPSQLVFYSVDGVAATQNHVCISSRETTEFHVDVQYHFQFLDSSALAMADEGDAFLFSADRNIRFVWKADEKRFRIDSEQSSGDPSLFDFSRQGLKKNFEHELEKLAKSEIKVKQEWLQKLNELDLAGLKGPEVVENLNAIEIMNLNDETNATVVLSLPEGFSTKKMAFPKAPNFEYHAEKNKVIDTVYSFEILNAQKDKFKLYGTEGLAGWFYDTSYYRNKPETSRFPNNSVVKSKVYEGETVLGKGEIFILECEITPKELRTEEYKTYELIYVWIPIENEDLAYNLAISVPLGEDSGVYAELVKTILQIQ
jgi:hypothetical protein